MKNKPYWIVVIACSLLVSSSVGICVNAVGIFYSPVSEALGVGKGAFALHTTLSGLTVGLISPFLVKLFTRFNSRLLLSVGVVLAALTTALMAFATSLPAFYILGILRGVGYSLFGMAPVNVIITNWFEKKHGFVTGLVFSFSGLGGAIFNSLFSWIIQSYSWQTAYLVVAAVILIISLPAALVINYTPAQVGMLPYGKEDDPNTCNAKAEKEENLSKKVLSNPAFIYLCILAFSTMFITGVSQYLPGFSEEIGSNLTFGATMVSAVMVGNIIFKFSLGVLSDKLGPITACFIMLSASVISLCLYVFGGAGSQQGYLLIISFFFGSIYSVSSVGVPIVTRYIFGAEYYGVAYGYVSVLINLGMALPLTIIGFTYDVFNTYIIAFAGCALLGALNLGILLIIRNKKRLMDN